MDKRKTRTVGLTPDDDVFAGKVSRARVVDPMASDRGINYLEGMDDEGLRDIARSDASQLAAENKAKIEGIREARSARESGQTQYGEPVPATAQAFIDRNQTQRGREVAESIARRPGETASSHMARIAGTEGARLSQLEMEERNFRASQDFNRRKAAYDAVIAAGPVGAQKLDPATRRAASEYVQNYPVQARSREPGMSAGGADPFDKPDPATSRGFDPDTGDLSFAKEKDVPESERRRRFEERKARNEEARRRRVTKNLQRRARILGMTPDEVVARYNRGGAFDGRYIDPSEISGPMATPEPAGTIDVDNPTGPIRSQDIGGKSAQVPVVRGAGGEYIIDAGGLSRDEFGEAYTRGDRIRIRQSIYAAKSDAAREQRRIDSARNAVNQTDTLSDEDKARALAQLAEEEQSLHYNYARDYGVGERSMQTEKDDEQPAAIVSQKDVMDWVESQDEYAGQYSSFNELPPRIKNEAIKAVEDERAMSETPAVPATVAPYEGGRNIDGYRNTLDEPTPPPSSQTILDMWMRQYGSQMGVSDIGQFVAGLKSQDLKMRFAGQLYDLIQQEFPEMAASAIQQLQLDVLELAGVNLGESS